MSDDDGNTHVCPETVAWEALSTMPRPTYRQFAFAAQAMDTTPMELARHVLADQWSPLYEGIAAQDRRRLAKDTMVHYAYLIRGRLN